MDTGTGSGMGSHVEVVEITAAAQQVFQLEGRCFFGFVAVDKQNSLPVLVLARKKRDFFFTLCWTCNL